MAADQAAMSQLSQQFAQGSDAHNQSDWESLVDWDGEFIDPFFLGDTGSDFTASVNYAGSADQIFENVVSNQNYALSLATSAFDGASSFDSNYTLSATQSIIDGPSSNGPTTSWFGNPPSYSTTATSLEAERHYQSHHGPSEAWDVPSSPAVGGVTKSPMPDTSNHCFSGSQYPLDASMPPKNLYVNGAQYALNNARDVTASLAFANVGGWADQPTIMEPVSEVAQSQPINIPFSRPRSFTTTPSSSPGESTLGSASPFALAGQKPDIGSVCAGMGTSVNLGGSPFAPFGSGQLMSAPKPASGTPFRASRTPGAFGRGHNAASAPASSSGAGWGASSGPGQETTAPNIIVGTSFSVIEAPVTFERPSNDSLSLGLGPHTTANSQAVSRAITIPLPHRRATSYNPTLSRKRSVEQPPPILSASPYARKNTRYKTVARSNSAKDQVLAKKDSATSLSPTSINANIGWVSYRPSPTGDRLIPSGVDGNLGKRQRGRVGGLTDKQRRHANLMRKVGACSNCRKRKEKCDPGFPCKPCLEHYKGDLVNQSCRNHLSDLTKAFVSDRLGWHPTARDISSFLPKESYAIMEGLTYSIPLSFGFGPLLHVSVDGLRVGAPIKLVHDHTVYPWPPDANGRGSLHTHIVLPAILTADCQSKLPDTIDRHLSVLVTQHFKYFPLFNSPLHVLREIYIFCQRLPVNSPESLLLRQALKLLVLVHIGGDLTLPPDSTDPVLSQLISRTMPNVDNDTVPTPCLIRSQFGAAIPGLVVSLMKEVLTSLESLFLNRTCASWPLILAVLLTLLMALESIDYHAAKLPYHHACDATVPIDPVTTTQTRQAVDRGIDSLINFYSACFTGCHARLQPEWTSSRDADTPEDRFIEGLHAVMQSAGCGPEGYMYKKATEKREGGDMGFFFDRLVGRLLTLTP